MTTTPNSPTGPSESVRASDRERERVVAIINAAAGAGLLTLDEAAERQAEAYAARFRHELLPLTADLPGRGEHLVDPEPRPSRPPIPPDARNRLIGHAAIVAAAIGLFTSLWVVAGPHHHFFPGPLVGLLVLSVVIHARRVMGYGRRWSQYRPAR